MAAERNRGGTTSPAGLPPQATMGLLNYLTATALDEDYAVASRRHAAEGHPSPGRPGGWGLVMLALFGILVATAGIQTARNAAQSASSHSSLVSQVNDRKDQLDDRRARVTHLRKQVDNLQNRYLTASAKGRALQSRLTTLGVAAGAAPVRGPGIRVTVDDAPGAGGIAQQVQDKDLQKLVNGLWQVGAEAIAINGQRLSALSAIRLAGQHITVNYRDVQRPYVVSAVGNPKQMGAKLLDTAGGQTWLALRSGFGLRFDITSEESMKLPAASRLTLRYAHTAETAR